LLASWAQAQPLHWAMPESSEGWRGELAATRGARFGKRALHLGDDRKSGSPSMGGRAHAVRDKFQSKGRERVRDDKRNGEVNSPLQGVRLSSLAEARFGLTRYVGAEAPTS